jgi:hypothetical protein
LKVWPDKKELRMRRSNYGPLDWSLASPAPGTGAKFRRWNIVLIAILAFLVLGVFVLAEAPNTERNASNAANVSMNSKGSASTQHGNPDKSALPAMQNGGRSGDVNKNVKGDHHTG